MKEFNTETKMLPHYPANVRMNKATQEELAKTSGANPNFRGEQYGTTHLLWRSVIVIDNTLPDREFFFEYEDSENYPNTGNEIRYPGRHNFTEEESKSLWERTNGREVTLVEFRKMEEELRNGDFNSVNCTPGQLAILRPNVKWTAELSGLPLAGSDVTAGN